MFPCRQDGHLQTFICDYTVGTLAPAAFSGDVAASPKTATCPVTRSLDTLTLLTYRATALDSAGRSASTNYITYSGGPVPAGTTPATLAAKAPAALVGEDISVGDDLDILDDLPPPPPPPHPTARDVLRPIRVELDSPDQAFGQGPYLLARRIDIAFLPDADWETDYSGFSDATGEIVANVYFRPLSGQPGPSYADDYYYWRQRFSLWAGPVGAGPGGAPDDCFTRELRSWALAARALTDGQTIVHRLRFQGGVDCGQLGFGGWGTVWAGAHPSNPPSFIFVHETGHFLHCLGDEYPIGGSPSCSNPRNTFPSQTDCAATATAFKFPVTWCRQFDFGGFWHIANGDPEIMAGAAAHPSTDWQDTNHHVIQSRMAACVAGACY